MAPTVSLRPSCVSRFEIILLGLKGLLGIRQKLRAMSGFGGFVIWLARPSFFDINGFGKAARGSSDSEVVVAGGFDDICVFEADI